MKSSLCLLLLFLLLLLARQSGAAVPVHAPDEHRGASGPGLITNRTLNVDGADRQYHLFLPADHDNAPVVMLFHGHNSDHDELLGLSGGAAPFGVWLDIAERENLILVVPKGLFVSGNEKGWNDCRADAPTNSNADDVRFIRLLLDSVVPEHRANPRRIYATGVSNGGHFAIRLAQEIPDRLAAFAAINAANAANSECAESNVAVSALFMNGTADPLLPYAGGPMAGNRGEVVSTEDSAAYWVARNGIGAAPESVSLPDANPGDDSSVERSTWSGGIGGSEVTLFKVVNGGHTAPSIQQRYGSAVLQFLGNQNADIEMANEVWAFFEDKTATRSIGNLGSLLFDAASPGDGFYIVSDGRYVSVAFFGYSLGGALLWLVGTEPVSELWPRFGADMVFPLLRGGPHGNFHPPQDPGADPLPAWGELRLNLGCTDENPPRLSGSAVLDGQDGIKTLKLSSTLYDPEACRPLQSE